MSSILKVDTIQDQSGNNIINESGNVITIGASGDTITVPAGATVSGFTSTGIDDNADATAITIDSSERVLIKTTDIGYSGFGDILTIGSASGNNGMTLRSGTSNYGTFYFSDATGTGAGTYAGKIQYNHSDNSMRIATNSSDRMTILSDGKIGIGTVNPSRQLTVSGSTAPVIAIVDTGTSGSPSLFFGDSSADNVGKIQYSNSDNSLATVVNGSERVRITSAGLVGIGTSSPLKKLVASNNGAEGIEFGPGETSDINLMLNYNRSTSAYIANQQRASYHRFDINTSEGMRLTSTGLGIGTSSPSKTLDVAGDAIITKNDTPLYLNRTGTDGEIVRFSKDGTSNGQIATFSSKMYIGTGNANFRFRDDLTAIIPANSDGSNSDNDLDLGYSSVRWRRLYLSEGVFLGGTGTSNKLDDYEEGTFTPLFTSGGGGTASGYGTQTGRYTKIGRLVYIALRVTLSNKSGLNSGSVSVSGLPFSSNSGNAGRLGVLSGDINNISSFGLGDMGGTFLGPSSTAIGLMDNSQTSVTVSDLNNNSTVDFQMTYETS